MKGSRCFPYESVESLHPHTLNHMLTVIQASGAHCELWVLTLRKCAKSICVQKNFTYVYLYQCGLYLQPEQRTATWLHPPPCVCGSLTQVGQQRAHGGAGMRGMGPTHSSRACSKSYQNGSECRRRGWGTHPPAPLPTTTTTAPQQLQWGWWIMCVCPPHPFGD